MEREQKISYEKLFITDEQKAKAFDELAKNYYEKNFGSMGKAEIDLLMFSLYMDRIIEIYSSKKGVLDYKESSGFKIGTVLGITPEKVRNLKLKKQARYPQNFNWIDSLVSIRDSVRYDEEKRKIIIPVQDPNLYNEIRGFIEDKGGYIEIQRGGNYIQIRPEYFLLLVYESSEDKKEQEKMKREVIKKLKESNKATEIDEHMDMQEVAESLSKETFDFFQDVIGLFSTPLAKVFEGVRLISKMHKKK